MFLKTESARKLLTFKFLRNTQIHALPCSRSRTQDKLAEMFTMATSRLIAKFPNNLIAKSKLSFVSKSRPDDKQRYSKLQRCGVSVRNLAWR